MGFMLFIFFFINDIMEMNVFLLRCRLKLGFFRVLGKKKEWGKIKVYIGNK